MVRVLCLGYVVAVLAVGLVACASETVTLSEPQVRDLAWQSLEPNTSSHNQANWEFIEVKQVIGREVAEQFEGEPAPGCWQGPPAVPNEKVNPSGTYWYVHLKPRQVTPLPEPTISPTAPPNVPEPFMHQAFFLLDAADGRVVARKISCVIY